MNMITHFCLFKIFLLCNFIINTICLNAPLPMNTSKMIIIADVHADIYRFKDILRNAKIINDNDQWIAEPNTVVVQLGDQIDPKTIDNKDIDDKHHFKMIYYTDKLKHLAQQNNCDFISVIGNHELLNMNKIKRKPHLRDIIASRPVLLHFNNYLFCHGGFKKHHWYMLEIYNKAINDINLIWYKYVNDFHMTLNEEIILNNLILDIENSILFTRTQDCKQDIDKLFNILNIEYMFVGHTITEYITLKNKIWFLDLMLKQAFDENKYNYIVIDNGNIIVKELNNYSNSFLSLD